MSGVDASRLMRYVLMLRQNGATDPRVLSAMEKAPRSAFVDAAFASAALENEPLPIGAGQTSPKPSDAARLLVALDVQPDHRVLEVGSGSGFLTGVLAMMARKVVGVERRRALVSKARANLGALRVMNAHVHHGDGALGWREEAPYQRILLNGVAPPFLPKLIEQLVEGGMLTAPSGLPGAVRLKRFERVEDRLVERADFGPYDAAPLEPGVIEDE